MGYDINSAVSSAGYAGIMQRTYICGVCRNMIKGVNLKACPILRDPIIKDLKKIYSIYKKWDWLSHVIEVLEAFSPEQFQEIAQDSRNKMFYELQDRFGVNRQECRYEEHAKDFYCLSCRVGKFGVEKMELEYQKKYFEDGK